MPKVASSHALLPVRVVVERTGLSADVLRAWERRYGVVLPSRTAGGQRAYTEEQVTRLLALARLVDRGHAIGNLASATPAELGALAIQPVITRTSASATAAVIAAAIDATEQLDAELLERTLRSAALRLGIDEMLDQVLGPLLTEIGRRWHRGDLRTVNEHLSSAVIRGTLGWMMEVAKSTSNAPRIVVATPAGQMHELGAMLAAAAIAAQGARVIYLGPNLPAAEIAMAAVQTRANAVALSIVFPDDDRALLGELAALRHALPKNVDIVVGGAAVERYHAELRLADVRVERSLDGLRSYVRELMR